MQNKQVIFSVIMPTYNSEETIEKALRSIQGQKNVQNQIEILVIDGGSTDRTVQIAQKYRAKILVNEKKYPEYAKQIGIRNAKGKYLVFQDSDEVLTSRSQYANRLRLFQDNPGVYCILANALYAGKGCGICSSYLNVLGDPFGYFVYHNKGSVTENNKNYLVKKTKWGNIYQYGKEDVLPIGDAGTTTIDFEKAKELFGDEVYSLNFAVTKFAQMVSRTGLVGCAEGDSVLHFSQASFSIYLKKLRFKIIMNLNGDESAGFAGREKQSDKLSIRKYLFLLYGFSIVLPIFDSARLALKYRDISFLLHFVYTFYIIGVIAKEVVKKILGIKNIDLQYGK